jgi:putative peptidoglycan lipid II flippase
MSRRVLNASLLLMALFGLDKAVAFGLQRLVARSFGLGVELDAFNAANNLPDAIFSLISGGALAMVFIPVLTATLDREGAARFWQLFTQVLNSALVITAILAMGVALWAEPLAHFAAPGFTPERQLLVRDLMRLNLIALLLFSASGLVMGALQARQHFLLPALAPLFYNLGQAAGVLWLAPQFGVYGLAYGVIGGAALHLLIQGPGLWRYGFRWRPSLGWRTAAVQQVGRLMAPRVLTLLCINLIFIVNDRLASAFGAGPISTLALGWRLLQLPETLFGTALATALLPTLAALVAREQTVELRELLRRAALVMVALTVPAVLISWALLPWGIQALFEGSAFSAENTAQTVWVARLFMLGLTGHALKEITARTFYAQRDALTPALTALAALGLFIGLSHWLTPLLGYAALALANSLTFTLEAALMLGLLAWRRVI